MTILTVPDAEQVFDELIDRALAGEEVFVDCGDGRLVQIEPMEQASA